MTANSIDQLIGAEVRGFRAKKAYSREELSRRTGLSAKTIQRIESGERSADVSQLAAICRALGVDLRDLVNRAVAELGE